MFKRHIVNLGGCKDRLIAPQLVADLCRPKQIFRLGTTVARGLLDAFTRLMESRHLEWLTKLVFIARTNRQNNPRPTHS